MKIYLIFFCITTLIIGTKLIEAGIVFGPMMTGTAIGDTITSSGGWKCCDYNTKCCCHDAIGVRHKYDAGYKPWNCLYTKGCYLGFECDY